LRNQSVFGSLKTKNNNFALAAKDACNLKVWHAQLPRKEEVARQWQWIGKLRFDTPIMPF
jgi:hypothetical protein